MACADYEGESLEIEYADLKERLLAGEELDVNSLTHAGKQALDAHVDGGLAKRVVKKGRMVGVRTIISQNIFLNVLAQFFTMGFWGYADD